MLEILEKTAGVEAFSYQWGIGHCNLIQKLSSLILLVLSIQSALHYLIQGRVASPLQINKIGHCNLIQKGHKINPLSIVLEILEKTAGVEAFSYQWGNV